MGIKKYILVLIDLENKLETMLTAQLNEKVGALANGAAYYICFTNRTEGKLIGKFDTKVEAKLFADFFYGIQDAPVSLFLDEELQDMLDTDYEYEVIDHTKLRVNTRTKNPYCQQHLKLKARGHNVKSILETIKDWCNGGNSNYDREYREELETNKAASHRAWLYS